MRKLILIIALIVSNTIFSQSAFEKYERDENVTSFIAGKKTFAMIAKTKLNSEDEKIQKGKEILSGVESVQVYTTQNQLVAADMKKTFIGYSKSSGLEELMQINSSGKHISIMLKQGANGNIVTQMLAFIGNGKTDASKNNETVIVFVTGNFNLDDFSEMLSGKTVTGDKKTDDQELTQIKNALELKVSPNPVSGVFYINTDKPVDVKMYDLSGRLVKEQAYTSEGIATSGLIPATYIVEITSGDMKQTQKIIIE